MKLLAVYFLAVAFSCALALPADAPVGLPKLLSHAKPILDVLANGIPQLQSTVNITENVTININDNTQCCCNEENHKTVESSNPPKLPDGYVITSETEKYVTAIKFHASEQFWNEARKTCHREGGFLSYAESKEEEDSYLQMMRKKNLSTLWVGIHDYFEIGAFTTVLDEVASAVAYITWLPGNPDHLANERCVHYWRISGNEGLNDMPCNVKMPFNCKIKLRKH